MLSRRGRTAHAMTRDHTIDTPIASATQFEDALAAIVESAIEEGVDVRGAWEFKTDGSTHYWELNICELARQADEKETD
jgi:hypothetical protein